jgi:hypothetical protein
MATGLHFYLSFVVLLILTYSNVFLSDPQHKFMNMLIEDCLDLSQFTGAYLQENKQTMLQGTIQLSCLHS